MPWSRPALASLVLALALAAPLSASPDGDAGEPERRVDALTIRRKLNYTAYQNHGRARDVAHAILMYWGAGTRFSENAYGQWIVANRGGVMANGRPYAPLPGDGPMKVVMASDGNWIASTEQAFLNSGALFEDPELVRQVNDDVYSFQTMSFGRAAPIRSPLRAGPRLEPRGATVYTSPGTRVAPLYEARPAADDPEVERALRRPVETGYDLDLTVDTEPPRVTRVVITRSPDDPVNRRSGFPPRFFVGATPVEFEVLMSEPMGTPPRVEVEQADGTRSPAALSEDRNPFFRYRWFPMMGPEAGGEAALEIMGDAEEDPPQYGGDKAGNPIEPVEGVSVFSRGLVVDTLAPELRRTDQGDPGDISLIPGQDEVIAGHEFPRSVLAFVEDYDQPADPSGGGPYTTRDASGVHFRRIGDGTAAISMRLFKPDGQEIRGTLSSRISALELFLPDVYDPDTGIFEDRDGDGRADPDEGTYRVELALVDEVGNTATRSLPFGMDATPIEASQLRLTIRPIFSEPFPNPPDPLPPSGDVFVRRLERVEVTSPDPDFSTSRSNVRVDAMLAGPYSYPKPLVGTQTRTEDMITFVVSRDQDGDGEDDFENPEPGEYLPPGTVDPRLGRNDGLYRIVVEAMDQAGNPSTVTRDITMDTTPPEVGSAFPSENTTQYGPLRMVDVILKDPQARSGADGSGIRLTASQIRLRFLGNDLTPPQPIETLAFVHEPNDSDPTVPSYNPDDHFPKLLLEIVDENGDVTSLPTDGSFDGVYQLDVIARDRAGNEAMGTTTFPYVGEAPMEPTTGPAPEPLRMALVRP